MNIINGIGWIGLLTFCLGIYKICNGRLTSIADKIDKKVYRGECHQAQDAIKERIDTLEVHIGERFDDLKDTVIKNGK